MLDSTPTSRVETYHLFGFPIAHSASPTLHNYLFSRLGLSRKYKLTQATRVGARVRALCQANDFGGASVTMPLKVSIRQILDRTTDASRRIGAVNTIVPVRDDQGRIQLVGTNTDWLGIRNVLLNAWPASPASPFPIGASLVIGGGGAARAAVYALASLHCTPVYLVGRDAGELTDLVKQFSEIPCIPITDAAQSHGLVLTVACVPALPPATAAERAADACARAVLARHAEAGQPRVFLEMCYKPRSTPLMLHAGSEGWLVAPGIEAMIEQGLAQARMWLAKSVDPGAGTDLIPADVENGVRTLLREMPDILVKPGEEPVPNDEEFEMGNEDKTRFTARL